MSYYPNLSTYVNFYDVYYAKFTLGTNSTGVPTSSATTNAVLTWTDNDTVFFPIGIAGITLDKSGNSFSSAVITVNMGTGGTNFNNYASGITFPIAGTTTNQVGNYMYYQFTGSNNVAMTSGSVFNMYTTGYGANQAGLFQFILEGYKIPKQ